MKRALKIIILLVVAVAMAALTGWSYVSGKAADEGIVCRRVEVSIRGNGNSFVNAGDISSAVEKEFGRQTGRKLSEIDLYAIEKFTDKLSGVLKSEVYTSRDSVLNISITQRKPVLRFIREGISCYCDDRGYIIPSQGNTSARVQIVDGNVPVDPFRSGKPDNAYSREWVAKMVRLAAYIDQSQWKYRISQMRVDEHGDLVIYLKSCSEKIIFGTPDDTEAKFGRIETYYTHVKPNTEKKYKSVNVKFDRQIVCR